MSDSFSSETILQVHELQKTVPTSDGELTILTSVNLEIKKGRTVAITGVSGSGKTTLLSLLAGLDTPSSGSICLDGQRISDLDEDGRAAVRQQRVGFVFQSFHLLPHLSALENVMLPLELAGERDAHGIATGLLQRVGLEHRVKHLPKHLSGGEQQRVAIARAFATSPDILFADEPTGNLDMHNSARIADLLFTMNRERGTTLVLVTHDMQLAGRCQDVYTMENGHLRLRERP
ncbi:ABC transporter ATP-binding protein [Desulfurispirillum indicum]|uniref:ABC transporter ATP-binding protein n=1 Tax=Desulfurispirillum indicum TaxID=936456 RepID=UPI001CF95D3F|nr:ABC transporter ATP-binding protein [Desulfurispirillum indicum]UCZ57792.1 ABC transporter ATP-binding protein [Desulfurispirillum indicum]